MSISGSEADAQGRLDKLVGGDLASSRTSAAVPKAGGTDRASGGASVAGPTK